MVVVAPAVEKVRTLVAVVRAGLGGEVEAVVIEAVAVVVAVAVDVAVEAAVAAAGSGV